jgi:choline monooxygenase
MALSINRNIKKAHTLPADFYTNPAIFEKTKDQIFARTWHIAARSEEISKPNFVHPFTLYENYLDEPLLLTEDAQGEIHCLSNVCTHRGNILIEKPEVCKTIRCKYHGRCFELDGSFQSMPEFELAENFPTSDDDLHALQVGQWGKFIFVELDGKVPLSEFTKMIDDRLPWLPWGDFEFDPELSKEFVVNAHWALYCDNYLEGFHIPYVHKSLNKAIEYSEYTTETFQFGSLQLGLAKDNEDIFDLPPESPDYGKKIAAYYYFVFPNMMFNFYPWGLSLNIVKPIAPNKTKVIFESFVWDRSKLEKGAGADLGKVEMEDEEVVENVQRGVRSRFYKRGRFSPKMEQGVHHFHGLISEFLKED